MPATIHVPLAHPLGPDARRREIRAVDTWHDRQMARASGDWQVDRAVGPLPT